MTGWESVLGPDPLDWLLEEDDPAVRHLALRQLLDLPADDRVVAESRRAAMAADPIAAILAAQEPEGYWEKPGPGYATKLRVRLRADSANQPTCPRIPCDSCHSALPFRTVPGHAEG